MNANTTTTQIDPDLALALAADEDLVHRSIEGPDARTGDSYGHRIHLLPEGMHAEIEFRGEEVEVILDGAVWVVSSLTSEGDHPAVYATEADAVADYVERIETTATDTRDAAKEYFFASDRVVEDGYEDEDRAQYLRYYAEARVWEQDLVAAREFFA